MRKETRKAFKDLRSDMFSAASNNELDELKEIRKELSRLEQLTGDQIGYVVERRESSARLDSSGREGA